MLGVVFDVVQGVPTNHAQTRERQNRRMNVRDEDVPGYLRYTEQNKTMSTVISRESALCES